MKGSKLAAVVLLYTVVIILVLSAHGHPAYQHPSDNDEAPSNRAEVVGNFLYAGGNPQDDGHAGHIEIRNADRNNPLVIQNVLNTQIRLLHGTIYLGVLTLIYKYISLGNSMFEDRLLGVVDWFIRGQLICLLTTLLADVLYRRLNQNVGVVGPRAPVARNNNAISGNPTPGINEAAPTTGGPDINSRHDVGPSHRVHDGQAHGELVSSAGSTHLQPYSDPSASGSQTSSVRRRPNIGCDGALGHPNN
ncbi:hypothetical protein SeMB42_g07786 [Synchytrium endobioticum]|uniref:Uncharacterized protein n=1 Tax=Synchytrium endobioticum TaxID=286115 RepID=A0A507CGS9_9FUNG|nr:hypothetical protein SeMB42_g07786 [Synchytrium endobioticum]TPX38439.1 hypothetical protein SeLEV6574_g07786 [Synchytrium endobioticum]